MLAGMKVAIELKDALTDIAHQGLKEDHTKLFKDKSEKVSKGFSLLVDTMQKPAPDHTVKAKQDTQIRFSEVFCLWLMTSRRQSSNRIASG